ncbi:hypothetical protein NP233_g7135 [Leucocoprinus birnbaumii]|uniref:Uncharacterized protein n=1 Tax=Leucocoprinus birnbaumii TaxID=56174 RepID=A0AAD5YUW4_9AGAR|nr:hypothetical protein NP233_g7135 [Leucocoprinus birnbaumii]
MLLLLLRDCDLKDSESQEVTYFNLPGAQQSITGQLPNNHSCSEYSITVDMAKQSLTSFSLNDKVGLITGAASGIGLATAKVFLDANIKGLLLVDQTQEALDCVFQQLTSDEISRCDCLAADVSSGNSNYAEQAIKKWGHLDIAVLNAGIGSELKSILETDVKTWDRIMEVNARGGLQQCARVMVKRNSGSIVITASQLGLQGSPLLSAYSASKWAVRGLALTAAEELTPLGIRVNSVCPGPIVTPLINDMKGEDGNGWQRMADATLMKRLGQPNEIANAILYLASDAASFCSGTTLKVDGGYAKFG